MRSCRTASAVAASALVVASAVASCREAASPDVPPVTSALAPSAPRGPEAALVAEAGPLAAPPNAPPIAASFVDVPGVVEAPVCSRLMVAVARGKAVAMGETLSAGDVLVVTYPDPIKIEGAGLVLVARRDFDTSVCGVKSRPLLDKKVVRASAAPELRWAHGGMAAHLDVGEKVSPDVYLGRLEGSAGVAEHAHAGSWEILGAIEASGMFVLDGTEGHLGPRQVLMIPPGSKHAWKPDPGSKLVAIQLYSPPGPEQRFVALATAELDAGKDAR
ncbi:MAG TPA: cupin domain-containing protein [Labilithrix sp.]|nr:cupin domain-containing protein [Labilithrix sp.]